MTAIQSPDGCTLVYENQSEVKGVGKEIREYLATIGSLYLPANKSMMCPKEGLALCVLLSIGFKATGAIVGVNRQGVNQITLSFSRDH